ncbi:MAG: response regulator [Clostridiales bacterium]|nr:response regulator [Clostridiales bacterium]
MSVKIAICDDDINMQFIVEGLVEKIMERHGLKAEIECFDCGDALCEAYEVGKFDLIFLDIEYKGRNGVQVAKYIRETKDDEYVQIAFVSGASGYAMELFDYRPINFLTKPVSEADVKRVIDKFVRLYSQKIEYFSYKKGSAENRYNLSDIIYFRVPQGRSRSTEKTGMRSSTALSTMCFPRYPISSSSTSINPISSITAIFKS